MAAIGYGFFIQTVKLVAFNLKKIFFSLLERHPPVILLRKTNFISKLLGYLKNSILQAK